MIPLETDNFKMRMFPIENPMNGIGGCLIHTNGFHIPSATDGPLIYLNANPAVQLVLDKIEAAGGKVLVPQNRNFPGTWLYGRIY